MPKQRSHAPVPVKSNRVLLHIDMRKIEKKIRKPYAPTTKTHASKKSYRRKLKHPKRGE